MVMRICSRCNQSKKLDCFIINKMCTNGRAFICKTCQNVYSNNWKRKNSKRIAERRRELYHNSYGLSSKKRILERQIIREQNKPYTARARIMRANMATKNKTGIKFDTKLFTVGYLVKWLKSQLNCLCCHVLFDVGFKHDKKAHNDSPSMDRFDPNKGYVKGNISLICWKCNNLKRNATSDELRQIADWMDIRKLEIIPSRNG